MTLTRRSFLTSALGTGLAASTLPNLLIAQVKRSSRPPRILLRGSWQSVNIGDIGHTPGALNLIERHLPDAELTLWPTELGHDPVQPLGSLRSHRCSGPLLTVKVNTNWLPFSSRV